MDHTTLFPLKVLLNLSRRQDRRERCAEVFMVLGWPVERLPAVDARRLRSTRGFGEKGRYAHALSTRLALRRAEQSRAAAVLIMEDDIVLHPHLTERLAALELPADWAILYLGCQHHERPEPVARGLVQVRAPLDTHAWAVRAPYFRAVRQALAGRFWQEPGPLPAADILLAELARRVPAYALYPNAAWQQEEMSDLTGAFGGNYNTDGTVRCGQQVLPGLLAEVLGGRAWPQAAAEARVPHAWFWPDAMRPPPAAAPAPAEVPGLSQEGRVAFLFLTCGGHHHPGVWEEYWHPHAERVRVFAHTKDRTALTEGWLQQAQLAEHLHTEWGGLSLVQVQFALLHAALREPENEFFVFASESCLPVRPLGDLLRLLHADGRSRFHWESMAEIRASHPHKWQHPPAAGGIPSGQFRFHSQWVLLNREAAGLLAANEALLNEMQGGLVPDEYAFGTLLQAAGYPLESRVARRDVTWTQWPSRSSAHPRTWDQLHGTLAADVISSGCFFARKFLPGAVQRAQRLHLPPD
jgi:Core-2/I-Branching enzyme